MSSYRISANSEHFQQALAEAKWTYVVYPGTDPMGSRETMVCRQNLEAYTFSGEKALCVTGFSDGIAVWQSKNAYETKRNFNRTVLDKGTNQYLECYGTFVITYNPDGSENVEDMPPEVAYNRVQELYWPQILTPDGPKTVPGPARFGDYLVKDNWVNRKKHLLVIRCKKRPEEKVIKEFTTLTMVSLTGYKTECVPLDNGDGVVAVIIRNADQVFPFNRSVQVHNSPTRCLPIYGDFLLAYSEEKEKISADDLTGLTPEMVEKYKNLLEFPEHRTAHTVFEKYKPEEILE